MQYEKQRKDSSTNQSIGDATYIKDNQKVFHCDFLIQIVITSKNYYITRDISITKI